MTDEQTAAGLAGLMAALTVGDPGSEASIAAVEAAVEALATLTPIESAAVLVRLARSAASLDPDRRWWAVRALAALPHVDPLPQLIIALGDPEAAVRQCAALGLRMHPDLRVAAPLVKALGDPDPLTARLAVDALVAIGSEVVPTLIEALAAGSPAVAQTGADAPGASAPANKQPAVRLGALRALAAIGDTRAIPALFAALDGSTLEEYWANQGLERMGVGMSFFKP